MEGDGWFQDVVDVVRWWMNWMMLMMQNCSLLMLRSCLYNSWSNQGVHARWFHKRIWDKILEELIRKTKQTLKAPQVETKFNRLRQKHRIFSQLLQHTGMDWDAEANTVTASEEVLMNVLAVSVWLVSSCWCITMLESHIHVCWLTMPKAKEFRRKGCDNYIQLGTLFNRTILLINWQTPSNPPTASISTSIVQLILVIRRFRFSDNRFLSTTTLLFTYFRPVIAL